MSYFNENYYLELKLEQLAIINEKDPATGQSYTRDGLLRAFSQAGLTPQQHYESYGRHEGLDPNPYFNEYEYLQAKVNQLHSRGEKDAYGREYTTDSLSQLLDSMGMTAAEHYERYGSHERDQNNNFINPSNAFDANGYYSAKLAVLQASEPDANWTIDRLVTSLKNSGLSPISHYALYGANEATTAHIPMVQTVPGASRVHDDRDRELFGEVVPENPNPPTVAPVGDARGEPVTRPADVGQAVPASLSPPVERPANNLNPHPDDVGGSGGALVARTDAGGRLDFNGTGDVDVAIDGGNVVFARDGYGTHTQSLAEFRGVHLDADQGLRLDNFAELATFFSTASSLSLTGYGRLTLDLTAVSSADLVNFAGSGTSENAGAVLDFGGFGGKMVFSSGNYTVSSVERQFLEGPRTESSSTYLPDDPSNIVFAADHVRNSDGINTIEVNNATLIATKGQVSPLADMTIIGNGNVHIKADLGAQRLGGSENFTVQTTGTNYIAAGVGRDRIFLGQDTGTDILISKYNDTNYGRTKPWWDMVRNFETDGDKLGFITTWSGTNSGPAAVVQANVHQGQSLALGDFAANDGILTYTGADASFAAKSVFEKVGLALDALDAAIAAAGNGVNANDFWAYAESASEASGQQSVYILKADGKAGHNADYTTGGGYQNDNPGDTVIELVGVSIPSGAVLAGMLNPDVGNVYWGTTEAFLV